MCSLLMLAREKLVNYLLLLLLYFDGQWPFIKFKSDLWLQEPLKMMLVVVFPLLITKQTATKM